MSNPEMDEDLRAIIKAALEGDSNDAEHDALFEVAQAYGIEYVSYEERMEEEAAAAEAAELAERRAKEGAFLHTPLPYATEWRAEVTNGDTMLSYDEWVERYTEDQS